MPLSDTVASVLEDSVLESADSMVSNIKSAIKNERKEKENRTPSLHNKKKSTRKGTGTKGSIIPSDPQTPPTKTGQNTDDHTQV